MASKTRPQGPSGSHRRAVPGAASRGPVAVSAQLISQCAKMLEVPERGERLYLSRTLGRFGGRGDAHFSFRICTHERVIIHAEFSPIQPE